jgi:hypothetical protein
MSGALPALRLRWLWWALGLGYLLFILAGSLAPLDVAKRAPGTDVTQHLLGYGIAAFWFAQLHRRWLIVAIALIAYGALIEVLQPVLSNRFFEWKDILANSTGVFFGLALAGTPMGQFVHWCDQFLSSRSKTLHKR